MIDRFNFSEYKPEEKIFVLKNKNSEKDNLIIQCRLDFKGIKFNINLDDYECGLFLNPYLNAQNDFFAIHESEADRTVGYLFPLNELIEDSDSKESEQSNAEPLRNKSKEYFKAFKFYAYKFLLRDIEIDVSKISTPENCLLSDIIDEDIIVLIIYKPQVNNFNIGLKIYYPSLALHGYYNYSKTRNLTFYQYIRIHNDVLKSTIEKYFYKFRKNKNINLEKCDKTILENPIIDMLYENFLPIADNPLYRFHLLYQFIEYLIDFKFRTDLTKLINESSNLTSYEIFDELIDLKKERKRINHLLNIISFDDKDIIELTLKNYIKIFKPEYKKNTLGDYLYDIRNLLVHDYRSVLEKGNENELIPIIVLLEIIVHNVMLKKNLLET